MSFALPFHRDDGGRKRAGYRGKTGDCVTRAISIATGIRYAQVYRDLREMRLADAVDTDDWAIIGSPFERKPTDRLRLRKTISPRWGVPPDVYGPYLEKLGWIAVHCVDDEYDVLCDLRTYVDLPPTCIVEVPGHLIAIRDGVVRDTFQHSNPVVHGLWMRPMFPRTGRNNKVGGFHKSLWWGASYHDCLMFLLKARETWSLRRTPLRGGVREAFPDVSETWKTTEEWR